MRLCTSSSHQSKAPGCPTGLQIGCKRRAPAATTPVASAWQSLTPCLVQTFEGRTHALLQEAGIDLVDICKEEGFYITKRELSAPLKKRSRATFGDAAAPIDLPTPIELGQATEQCVPSACCLGALQCLAHKP